jgi:acetyl esterase/lipase
MLTQVLAGIAGSVETVDTEVPSSVSGNIPIRLYWRKGSGDGKTAEKNPIYLYFHGGGYMFGTLSGEDPNCVNIALALEVVVVNVCYRHTPQHRFPTQRTDAKDAYDWVVKHAAEYGADPSRIVVGGISAGGGLAAWLTLVESKGKDRPTNPIKGQVLGAPWLLQPSIFPYHLMKSREVSSPQQCRNAPVLPLSKISYMGDELHEKNPQDHFADVDGEKLEALRSLPRTVMLVAGRDVLRDEALLFGQNLKKLR